MIKLDVVRAVADATGMTHVRAEIAVEAILDAIKKALADGHRIEIRGFGVFFARPLKRGIGRNPKTGKITPIPEGQRSIRFKAGKDLQCLPYDPPTLST